MVSGFGFRVSGCGTRVEGLGFEPRVGGVGLKALNIPVCQQVQVLGIEACGQSFHAHRQSSGHGTP